MNRLPLALFGVLSACTATVVDPTPEDSAAHSGAPDTDLAPPAWTVTGLEVDGGIQLRLGIDPTGEPVLAFWANSSEQDGTCDEIEVAPPPRLRQTLHLATRAGGVFSVEEVARPVVALGPTGLDLALAADGSPWLAYTGSEPEGQYCGGHDAVLASRSGDGWTESIAAAESGDVVTGEAGSDAGFVVGLWPSLALDPAGEPAVTYRDAHFGSLQHDDLHRADAELAWRQGSGWLREAVDVGRGAGDYSATLFDARGRLVVVYAIAVDRQAESAMGVWAARREADATWSRVWLHQGDVQARIAAGIGPDGELVVAHYSPDDARVKLHRLAEGGAFDDDAAWSRQFAGHPSYDEGQHVSLAFTDDGRVVLAYRRCRRLSSAEGSCDLNDEGVILALETDDSFVTEVVARGELGSCGEYVDVAAQGDTLFAAWRCAILLDGTPVLRPFIASRELR